MKNYQYLFQFIQLTFFLGFANVLSAQSVDFQSSNLPILVIDSFGQEIPDEPKIDAHLGIIDNGDGSRNYLTDSFNGYDGAIGIELRGFSSITWPKKPYGFETRDSIGNNNNVSLLGMPSENDWTLHAPYVDKTLMRNVLLYQIANEMGMYAAKTRFCELVLNGEYMGVFVLIEKIKKDKNRVNISSPDSTNESGGYLLEMTAEERLTGGETYFITPVSGKHVEIKYPKSEDVTDQQFDYMNNYFSEFETILYSDNYRDSVNGYRKYIDVDSFIDNMLIAEAFNQLDVLVFSQFFHKKKDGKLFMGPLWDCNRSIGNARYFTSWATSGWWLKHPYNGLRALWADRLMSDSYFMERFANRWLEVRESIFSFDSIYSKIDYWVDILEESRVRNFERWPVLGVSINNKYVFDTYEEEISYIKNWISEKFSWLDNEFVSYLEQININLAFNNLYGYSSQEEGNYYNPAVNAVDGNMETRWSAENFPQWIEIDLQEIKKVNVLEVFPYQERAYQYIIEAKNDIDENYEIIVDRSSNTDKKLSLADTIDSKNVRFVKLTVSGCYALPTQWVSILEFGIYNKNITDIADQTNFLPIEFKLYQSYPNPFNPSATIEYDIAKPGNTRLSIYNVKGELITRLIDKYQKSGSYAVKFDGINIPSGVYYYQLINNNRVQSKSMILLK